MAIKYNGRWLDRGGINVTETVKVELTGRNQTVMTPLSCITNGTVMNVLSIRNEGEDREDRQPSITLLVALAAATQTRRVVSTDPQIIRYFEGLREGDKVEFHGTALPSRPQQGQRPGPDGLLCNFKNYLKVLEHAPEGSKTMKQLWEERLSSQGDRDLGQSQGQQNMQQRGQPGMSDVDRMLAESANHHAEQASKNEQAQGNNDAKSQAYQQASQDEQAQGVPDAQPYQHHEHEG